MLIHEQELCRLLVSQVVWVRKEVDIKQTESFNESTKLNQAKTTT